MQGMDTSHHPMPLMPGMLSPEQMDARRKAKGSKFDFATDADNTQRAEIRIMESLDQSAAAAKDPAETTRLRLSLTF